MHKPIIGASQVWFRI